MATTVTNIVHDEPYLGNRIQRENSSAIPNLNYTNFNLGFDLTVRSIKIGKLAELKDLWIYSGYFVLITFSISLSVYFVFQTSHAVIRPLRTLNLRMIEVIEQENINEGDFGGQDDDTETSCKEILNLQDQFFQLLSDYNFTKNTFLTQ